MSIREFGEKLIIAETEALNTGNFSSLEALYDAGVVTHHPPFPDSVGWETVKESFEKFRLAIPDKRIELKYLTGDSNLLALSFKAFGTFTGKVKGWPLPTGKEITDDAIQLFRLRDGKIIEVWLHAAFKGLT